MKRTIVVALAAAAALLGTGAAQAARVDFSVGFAVPPVVVVAGPGYVGEPGYPPAVYPVIEAPRPRYWSAPLPVPRLPPPPWAWHHEDRYHDGRYHDGWRDGDRRADWYGGRDHGRDGWRDDGRVHGGDHGDHDGRHDGGRGDAGRDADHRGTRGPW